MVDFNIDLVCREATSQRRSAVCCPDEGVYPGRWQVEPEQRELSTVVLAGAGGVRLIYHSRLYEVSSYRSTAGKKRVSGKRGRAAQEVQACTQTRAQRCTCSHVRIHAHTCARAHTRTYTHTSTPARTHAHPHAHTHARTHTIHVDTLKYREL